MNLGDGDTRIRSMAVSLKQICKHLELREVLCPGEGQGFHWAGSCMLSMQSFKIYVLSIYYLSVPGDIAGGFGDWCSLIREQIIRFYKMLSHYFTFKVLVFSSRNKELEITTSNNSKHL